MTPNQFRKALERLGLTQTEAAPLLGVQPRAVRRWLAGDREIPNASVILVLLMLNGIVARQDIEKLQLTRP
jgi:hypothetical protein